MSEKEYDLIIVGGGAAGLMAGIWALRSGLRVMLFERLVKTGRRLLASGGGRCNYSRDIPLTELIDGYYGKKNFVRAAIYNFPPAGIQQFFSELGLESLVETGGGIYPATERAADVLSVLCNAYTHMGGEIVTGTAVNRVLVHNKRVCGIVAESISYNARAVLLAGGGCSMPELGADGSGFVLARELGHTVVPAVAGLTGLVLKDINCTLLAGVSLNGTVKIRVGKKLESYSGSIIFTHKGISGPAILDISRWVSMEVLHCGQAEICISWNQLNVEEWRRIFTQGRSDNGKKSLVCFMREYLPKRFVSYILATCGIKEDILLAELKRDYSEKLSLILGEGRLVVSRSEGLQRAMVTCGGVATTEVSAKTLQSKILQGMYFAGEILDVDGRCGGYNLEWAFASGRLAAQACAAELKNGSDRISHGANN